MNSKSPSSFVSIIELLYSDTGFLPLTDRVLDKLRIHQF